MHRAPESAIPLGERLMHEYGVYSADTSGKLRREAATFCAREFASVWADIGVAAVLIWVRRTADSRCGPTVIVAGTALGAFVDAIQL